VLFTPCGGRSKVLIVQARLLNVVSIAINKGEDMQKETFVTVPAAWLVSLLDRVPEKCSKCGKEVPGAKINGDVCDDCIKVKK
jgi:hypothetical protein